MSWRIRPEELFLEVSRPFSSKMNLQQTMTEVNKMDFLREFRTGAKDETGIAGELLVVAADDGFYHYGHLQSREGGY
ncbi:hypothetical protein TSAR_014829 [Trichomalopsis sarcophagae]|uniref:Uncharacterized protein n=1 Tax=Trichomalopsis sarcophagae TaxID=543379 RepID=A0A232EYJ3_9HYME|nr:hypothetical protein TSAR_014829 [Trichomalopsis sarcophagae]